MTGNVAGMLFIMLFRILGILLLILLGLLLLVLLMPICYRVRAVFEETRQVSGTFYWLGFVIRVPFWWDGEQICWKLRIMGIPVWSGREPAQDIGNSSSAADSEPEEPAPVSNENVHKTSGTVQTKGRTVDRKTQGRQKTKKDDRNGNSILCRIRILFRRFKQWVALLRSRLHSAQDLLHLLQADFTKRFVCIAKENMLHLWRQIRPRKVSGNICFGTGDPCSTGQILGLLGMVYGWIGPRVTIIPDFEQSCFMGRLKMKGRIRVLTVLVIAMRILFHKDFKQLQREWERWKEEF